MKFKNISIRYSLMLIIMIIIIPIFIIISEINYINLKNNILNNANIAINQSKHSVIDTIKRTEENYELVSSYYDPVMKETMESFKNEYNNHKENLNEMKLKDIKEEHNNMVDLYLIDNNGIIDYSTFPKAVGIDFKQFPDFYKKLIEIKNAKEIEISKVTSELKTHELRKWGYLPTDDHKYILEVGIASKELKKYIKKIDYAAMTKELKNINPYIDNIAVYDKQHFILGEEREDKNLEEIKIIDKVFSTEKNFVIYNKLGVPYKEYLFLNNLSSAVDDSKKVVKIEYKYNSITEKINKITQYTTIVITIYILFSLLIIYFITYKFITNPIVCLTKKIKEVSDKNLSVKVEVYSENEIGQLAESFNEMSAKLASTLVSKNNLENIIDSVGDIFIILDDKFVIKRINQYALNLLEYNLEKMENQPVSMIFHETFNVDKVKDEIKYKGFAENIENVLVTKKYSLIAVLSVFTALRDDDGKIYGYTCISKDISKTKEELKHMEEINKNLKREKTMLTEISSKDWLTGIFNREYVFKYLEDLLKKPTEKEISVIMIDVDYFKRVNDIYGHPIGDILLKEIASIIETNLRKEQVVGRYGGEEFLIVLPHTDVEEAFNLFESIRKEVETKNFNDIDIKITISGGITSWDGNNLEDLIRSVDKLLYKAKGIGRNCGVKK